MQLQPPVPIEEKRKSLTERLIKLSKQYESKNQQIDETLDKEMGLRLKEGAERIFKEMEEVDRELKQLDARKPDLNRRHLNFQQNLSKIDFDTVIKKIDQLIRQFRKGVRRDALLLVEESLSRAGELCLTEIRERLSRETGDFKHIEFEFSHTERLDKIGFLDGLAKYLGIIFTQDTEQYEKEYIHTIIKKICHSLQGGSIVFLEIRKWDALPCQEKELFWFVTDFWIPLIDQLEVITKTHRQVKFISVIVANGKLSSECLNSPALCSSENNLNILKLPLRKWRVNDIQIWLESYPGLQNPSSLLLAQDIHRSSMGGIPAMVCTALSQEFLK